MLVFQVVDSEYIKHVGRKGQTTQFIVHQSASYLLYYLSAIIYHKLIGKQICTTHIFVDTDKNVVFSEGTRINLGKGNYE